MTLIMFLVISLLLNGFLSLKNKELYIRVTKVYEFCKLHNSTIVVLGTVLFDLNGNLINQ